MPSIAALNKYEYLTLALDDKRDRGEDTPYG